MDKSVRRIKSLLFINSDYPGCRFSGVRYWSHVYKAHASVPRMRTARLPSGVNQVKLPALVSRTRLSTYVVKPSEVGGETADISNL